MAFPIVAATNTGVGDSSSGTTHTANLPAGIASNDLLLLFCSFFNDPGTVSAAGFTFLSTDSNAPAFLALGYKSAGGSEGTTITVTTGNSVKGAFTSYRITGWEGAPQKGTAATGNSNNANPPNLSPSWGANDTLWIPAVSVASTSAGGVTAAPANYTNLLSNSSSGPSAGSVGSAQQQLNAASENPGTFTNANAAWVAQTFAVQPIPLGSMLAVGSGVLRVSAGLAVKTSGMFLGSSSLRAHAVYGYAIAARLRGVGDLAVSADLGLVGSAAFTGESVFSIDTMLFLTNSIQMLGAGSLAADTTTGVGVFARFFGAGAFFVSDVTGDIAANALFGGLGKFCIEATTVVGSIGRTTNRVVTGPGPTNNAVV